MPESFGARLRQRREQQQIALATIAEQTKIKMSLLEGLERDNTSHWPVGIFRRAFIRAYADAIGLESTAVLKEFLALHPDRTEEIPAVTTDLPLDGNKLLAKPPTRLRFLVGSALSSLSRGREGAIRTSPSAVNDPANTAPLPVQVPFQPDLRAVARLCTALGRVDQRSEIAPLLAEAVQILDAVGLIIWAWDSRARELKPVLAHGYHEMLLAKLPAVTCTSDNATAAAFRSAAPCIVEGSDRASGAVVVPLLTPNGCGGVLALELATGREHSVSVHAVVTIFAAQLARWIRAERQVEMPDRRLA